MLTVVAFKPRPRQQKCRSTIRLMLPKMATMTNEFIVKFRRFDKVEKIERVQFVSTLSKESFDL